MTIPNTTFRAYVEKLGATEAANFIGNEGDLFYDPNTASLRVSDGVTPGGVPVTGVTTITGPIQQSLIPDADNTYDLGSPTNQWRDLYLTNNTMYLGGTQVAISTAGKLSVDGEDVATEAELVQEANQRLIVNTDRRVYNQGVPGEANPNEGGGWYHRTTDGSYIRWNFWTPRPNGEGPVGLLGNLESAWCLFTPWSTTTDYPYLQFYTLPKLGLGNAATWYRSRVTYTRSPETQVVGTPVLLYIGEDPTDVYPGVPRRELTLNGANTEGPQDADEFVYSFFVSTSSGLSDGDVEFSSIGVGVRYLGTNYSYGLYAVPDPSTEYDGTFNYLGVGTVTSNLVPQDNETLDLGTAEKKWRDLYLSSNTIYLGDTTIGVASTSVGISTVKLTVGGEPVAEANDVYTKAECDEQIQNYLKTTSLLVNTDPRVYADGAQAQVNPNNTGDWYYTNAGGGEKINWYFFGDQPNAPVNTLLSNVRSLYAVVTPWSVGTRLPFVAIYTLPQGDGNDGAAWYRSRLIYDLDPPPTPFVPGSSSLLWMGDTEPGQFQGLSRIQLTYNAVASVGPQDPSEVVFTAALNTDSSESAGGYNFSTSTIGYNLDRGNTQISLYTIGTNP